MEYIPDVLYICDYSSLHTAVSVYLHQPERLPFAMGYLMWCLGLVLGLSLKNLPFMWHVSSE
ncbi:hypothetical protein BDV37DRAFT_109489 [Aspergillus pseudonomiae]|uniref:Uncharacterized protein n=1 Tax=Aspergillus pseudonomiae TaxID=1506151 RepID=A0A5N7DUH0_9EURO|nr:uncharacterized protein BDV37DRAFT_109489 [Aspergillus pseudonomiae]KAE8409168.1 hypothetical protein BDV37DRAFT_109489 [Aspergillus pseudonomiae]